MALTEATQTKKARARKGSLTDVLALVCNASSLYLGSAFGAASSIARDETGGIMSKSYIVCVEVSTDDDTNLLLPDGSTIPAGELLTKYALPSSQTGRLGTGIGMAVAYWATHGIEALCDKIAE